tara:strand:- start:1812 stop:1985 length:174 start_codon:yes stop_codon:yes gene_type:complete
MKEFEILSEDSALKKIEKLSERELKECKLELIAMAKRIDLEIIKRKEKKQIAESLFK